MSFLRTLAKIGLVELDPSAPAAKAGGGDPDMARWERLAAGEDPGPRRRAAPAPEVPDPDALLVASASVVPEPVRAAAQPAPGSSGTSEIQEQQDFDQIYERAGVRASPFSAEKLLRLLAGLEAMDPVSRRTAVEALDAADDRWSIEDPLLDAERKVAALAAEARSLDRIVAEAEKHASEQLTATAEYQEKATAEIRRQIQELEQLLQEELTKVAEERAAVQSKLTATKESAAREKARLDAEVGRLRQLEALFGNATPTGSM